MQSLELKTIVHIHVEVDSVTYNPSSFHIFMEIITNQNIRTPYRIDIDRNI